MATATKKTTKVMAKNDAPLYADEVIKNPRITEKATMVVEKNIYTFDVVPNATKSEIKKSVQKLFKVTPTKIAIITIRQKHIVVRGKRGLKAGGKKALVYLKKGDKINFV